MVVWTPGCVHQIALIAPVMFLLTELVLTIEHLFMNVVDVHRLDLLLWIRVLALSVVGAHCGAHERDLWRRGLFLYFYGV